MRLMRRTRVAVVGKVFFLGAVSILCGGCGGGLLDSPSSALHRIAGYTHSDQWGSVWDNLDRQSREKFAKQQGVTDAEEAREAFVRANIAQTPIFPRPLEIIDETVEGDSARVRITDSAGSERTIFMAREDGVWKLSLAGTLHPTEWDMLYD